MSYILVATKSEDSTFRRRLRVALTEQCRWVLDMTEAGWPGGITTERFEALQQLARNVLGQLDHQGTLTRWGILMLLPWQSIDPDDDSELLQRVSSYFTKLSNMPLPE